MFRLFPAQGFHELWRCSHLVAFGVTKRKIPSFLPVCSSSGSRLLSIPVRLLNTGSPLWKDALQPKPDKSDEAETIDLDKWKSVMRSQVASEEKQQIKDEEEASHDGDDDDDDDDGLKESGGDGSSLEATRDLVAMWREAGKLVPEEMTDEEVQALAQLPTKSAKKKYLKFLAIKEGRKKARKAKKEKTQAQRTASIEQSISQNVGVEERTELKNTFLRHYWNRSLDTLLAWRSAQSLVFGQPLVFDMSYDSHMSRREVENTVSQILDVEAWNRRATEPYHLHFCNLQPEGPYMQELLKRYGAETWDRLLITATAQQHVDVFPHNQLVYLTADSPNVLRKFDHSKVYIIGAMVDRSIKTGLSLANAKRLKLATARLPLDEYLHWDAGAKNLTLDQMIRIMITIRETGKWEEALKFVPKRKHYGFHPHQTQRDISSNGENGDRRIRSNERTFKNKGQSLHRAYKQPGFTARDRAAGLNRDRENIPAGSRVQTSLKDNMDVRKGAGRGKPWWDSQ